MDSKTPYQCIVCGSVTTAPNFSDASYTDWEGEIHRQHIPVCPKCGGDCKRLSTLPSQEAT